MADSYYDWCPNCGPIALDEVVAIPEFHDRETCGRCGEFLADGPGPPHPSYVVEDDDRRP